MRTLANKIELWSHHFPQLKRIMDAQELHKRCVELANDMGKDPKHHLWGFVNNLPNNLI